MCGPLEYVNTAVQQASTPTAALARFITPDIEEGKLQKKTNLPPCMQQFLSIQIHCRRYYGTGLLIICAGAVVKYPLQDYGRGLSIICQHWLTAKQGLQCCVNMIRLLDLSFLSLCSSPLICVFAWCPGNCLTRATATDRHARTVSTHSRSQHVKWLATLAIKTQAK